MRARSFKAAAAGAVLALVSCPSTVRAQAGVAQKPLPNVLLLVDNSGSMERMLDGTLPKDNIAPPTGTTNVCVPGTPSNPNRWGILIQAMTGNLQPYSCAEMSRAKFAPLTNEYRIGTNYPYDTDYFLPHHRPVTGLGPSEACVISPWRMPGTGAGIGPTNQASTDPKGNVADSFPNDVFRFLKYSDLSAFYNGPGAGSPIPLAQTCDFLQADDGQLDAARDYVRFGLMTFDNDIDPGLGVTAVTNGQVGVNPFVGQWSYQPTQAFPYGGNVGSGAPAGCAASPFEVGARNWAAPPWEGRAVRFPDPLGTLADVQRNNDQIQQVLVSSRPYGATPIDAMVHDARDYLWRNPEGPGISDPYVVGGCREQFNILLTDGAPNLALRTSCEGAGGRCPYPSTLAPAGTRTSVAWDIVKTMSDGSGGQPAKTFVIGFSVNGTTPAVDGFPGALPPAQRTCSGWFTAGAPTGFGGNSANMSSSCRSTPPPVGSTAAACCELNEIAYYGTNPNGQVAPFFADSQQALANAFGQVLALITKTASTRTVPAYTSPLTSSGGAAAVTASFTAAFVPNPRKPWSGQLNRFREKCVAGVPAAVPGSPNSAQGDRFEDNVSAQSISGGRLFITARGDTIGASAGGAVSDSARTMRPFMATNSDMAGSTTKYQGQEVGAQDIGLYTSSKIIAGTMGIENTTCKASRNAAGVPIPALSANECGRVVWGFTTASQDNPTYGGYNGFNVRCPPGGIARCAVTGTACANDAACASVNKGDVCVPPCAALGAIFRATPAAASAPSSFTRDEGYRVYADARKTRTSALFVATTDGVLHGFKALDENGPGALHELWAFVPPAILPRLPSNYPAGQQILLDGSPVVKDVVWDRDRTQIGESRRWHTTLVAGLGTNGPGYYALNVSDVDCSGPTCNGNYQEPAYGQLDQASTAAVAGADNSKKGPHFLWQITDIERLPGDPAALLTTRKTPIAPKGDNKSFVSLFGRQSGTPAITTLFFKPSVGANAREIGVAVLPGGQDGPPDKTGTCARIGGPNPVLSATGFGARGSVRQWGATCASPVAGRGVTLVRLDTGAIIRHFGRASDTPAAIATNPAVFTPAPFDSPMTGVPVVFPTDTGIPAQKIFVGDADGTMWRIDVTDPDPANWRVNLFQDLFAGMTAADSQPVVVPPILSLDPTGSIVMNVATGEQENLVATPATNRVWSLVEGRPSATLADNAQTRVQWYLNLRFGERVTGPMAVFDRTHYFATYLPEQNSGAGVCSIQARQFVYGMDYYRPKDLSDPSQGGDWKWPPSPFTQKQEFTATTGNALIPGVAVRQSLACVDTTGPAGTDYFGNTQSSAQSSSGSSFALDIPIAGGVGGNLKTSVALPQPSTPASIDAWALVID